MIISCIGFRFINLPGRFSQKKSETEYYHGVIYLYYSRNAFNICTKTGFHPFHLMQWRWILNVRWTTDLWIHMIVRWKKVVEWCQCKSQSDWMLVFFCELNDAKKQPEKKKKKQMDEYYMSHAIHVSPEHLYSRNLKIIKRSA